MGAERQIKSRERVEKHGEVFTAEREVNAMLDLVKQETERIESRFLEPACGDGNFLIEILRRKLAICETRIHAKQFTQLQYERHAVWAVSSIYGIELLPDNAEVKALSNKYVKRYGTKVSTSTPNMSVFGFDVGMFLVNAYINDITPGDKASAYKGIQTNFYFERANNWTGYINKSVRIINLTPSKELKITDLNE